MNVLLPSWSQGKLRGLPCSSFLGSHILTGTGALSFDPPSDRDKLGLMLPHQPSPPIILTSLLRLPNTRQEARPACTTTRTVVENSSHAKRAKRKLLSQERNSKNEKRDTRVCIPVGRAPFQRRTFVIHCYPLLSIYEEELSPSHQGSTRDSSWRQRIKAQALRSPCRRISCVRIGRRFAPVHNMAA